MRQLPFDAARRRIARSSDRLPLALLLLALATLFLFGGDRDAFYRPSHHSWNSSQSMAMAENLSPSHNFLLFHGLHPGPDGTPTYAMYNRFPVGGYALVKLAALPFGDDLSAKILAARILMLALFSAAALLAYHAIARIASNRWIALTAALLSFSSYYMLYYGDMISNEVTIDLFAVMVVFHGMVVFVQEGRFRQLLIKACAALLLGWHVYALLLPFIAFGLARELLRAWQLIDSPPPPQMLARIRSAAAAVLLSRYMILGVVALMFGVAVLSFNFFNEYNAARGRVPLTELSSFQSMLKRTGQNEGFNIKYADQLAWPYFLREQIHRVWGASVPYALTRFVDVRLPHAPRNTLFVAGGALALCACFAGLLFVRRRAMPLAALALAGFFWALPLRTTAAFHDFESVFYVGVPLAMFTVLLLLIRRQFDDRVIVGISAAAMLVFVLSSFQMGRIGHGADASEFQEAVTADFERIREIAHPGDTVFVSAPTQSGAVQFAGADYAVEYYLSGRVIRAFQMWRGDIHDYDFLVSNLRVDGSDLLTPENREIFLYRGNVDPLFLLLDDTLGKSERVFRGDYDVYLSGKTLIYARDGGEGALLERDGGEGALLECDTPVVGEPFGVALESRIRADMTSREAWQWERGSDAEGWANIPGPRTPTYVYTPTAADVGYRLRAHVYYTYGGNRLRAVSSASEPVRPSGPRPRFFLHVFPTDPDDLPKDRRQYGFDNLDFQFEDRRIILRMESCAAMVDLPAYEIESVRTGQFITSDTSGEGEIWETEFPVSR